jgi:hypothetical protein
MRRIGLWIDSESVRVYQAIIYSAYIAAGVQSLAMGSPTAVSLAMGRCFSLVWIALMIVCPCMSLVGQWQRQRPASLWLQLAGDAGVTAITAAYAVAVLQATWAQRATVGAWLATSIMICGALMTWRDMRRIGYVARRTREMDIE